MIILGITGGVGMGKSTTASVLIERGLPVVDTDELARELVEPGQPALAEIRAAFGDEIIDPEGRLRRDQLAVAVFTDSSRRRKLESILHPRIRERWLTQVGDWRREGRPAAAIVIPLLFETDATSHFTHTVCVACSSSTQRARLQARGWNDREIDRRNASQWPIDKKMAASHFVVWTEGSVDVHRLQLDVILTRLGLNYHTGTGLESRVPNRV
jgi:dephospho-CoA kinase